MGFFRRIFGGRKDRQRFAPLYAAIVASARAPHWYADGGVPDTVDGRFDMVAALLALCMLRLEGDEKGREASSLLAELFVDDMEASLRQIGIGDLVVGKEVLKLMGALGGRLAAFRDALADGGLPADAVRRNIFREAPPSDASVQYVASRLRAFADALGTVPIPAIVTGELPAT